MSCLRIHSLISVSTLLKPRRSGNNEQTSADMAGSGCRRCHRRHCEPCCSGSSGGLNLLFESEFNLREEKTSRNQHGARFMWLGLKTAGMCAFQRPSFKQSARTNLELKPYRRTSAPVDLVIGRQSETTCFLLLLHGR